MDDCHLPFPFLARFQLHLRPYCLREPAFSNYLIIDPRRSSRLQQSAQSASTNFVASFLTHHHRFINLSPASHHPFIVRSSFSYGLSFFVASAIVMSLKGCPPIPRYILLDLYTWGLYTWGSLQTQTWSTLNPMLQLTLVYNTWPWSVSFEKSFTMDQVGPTLACSSTEDSILPSQRCQPQTRDSLLSLPAGFPSLLKHALAWTGNDWKNEQDFVYQLSENDLLELRSSLAAFKGNIFLYSFVFRSWQVFL